MSGPAPRPPRLAELPRAARVVLAAVIGAAAAVVVLSVATAAPAPWGTAALALVLCVAAGTFEVKAPGNLSFQLSLVPFLAGALLLPTWCLLPLALAAFLPGVLRARQRWYMPAFNVANYVAAGAVCGTIQSHASALTDPWRVAVAVLAATAVNHLLLLCVIATSRARSQLAVLRGMADAFRLDVALALTAAAMAELWLEGRELALLAAGPLLLVHQALWVPLLRHRSRIDAKTGLFHAQQFRLELEDAVAAARRQGAPVSLAMFDLDHLRAVNNALGHLAGDEVIGQLARLLREAGGASGVPARFGGEEFALLLPGVENSTARVIAETVRAGLEQVAWPWEAAAGVHPTVSCGVSTFPEHAEAAEALVAAADAALYDAKLSGRNRVRSALGADAREHLHRGSIGVVPPAPVPYLDLIEPATPEPSAVSATPARGRKLIPWLTGSLVALAAVAGALAGLDAIERHTVLFILLTASFLVLDHVRIDLFERAHVSPASVPAMALAFALGPVGPLAAETVLALVRLVRREQPVKALFDLGSLGLAGAAAGVVYEALHGHGAGVALFAAALGGLAYYTVNAPTLAAVMALAEGETLGRVWRERLSWLAPHYVGFGLTAGAFALVEDDFGLLALVFFGAPLFLMWLSERQYVDRSRDSVKELRRHRDELQAANASLRGLLETNQELLGTTQRSYLSTITSLARTIEAKDPYTGGHTERVGVFALMLARELGMPEEDLRAVEVGAVIHDIGKIGVPDQILTKEGRLTDVEFAEMRRHPEISSYIVSELELPPIVKQMVRSHHERYDGGGYPDGLVAEEIPLAARILAVADALDAMTSDRSYRAAMPLECAVAEIKANRGRQFCPLVVDAFLALAQRDPELGGRPAMAV